MAASNTVREDKFENHKKARKAVIIQKNTFIYYK